MSRKTLGIVLIIVGLIAMVLSLGADAMGIGNNMGMGWKQAVGAVVGVIVLAVGAWYWPGFPASRMISAAPSRSRAMPASGTRRKARVTKTTKKTTRRRRR